MNLDFWATVQFGDTQGLKSFFLVHRFVHDQTAAALTTRFGLSHSTFGLSSSAAESAWAALMRDGERAIPEPLTDWLKFHADMHNQSYSLLGGGTVAPDLSIADFSRAESFNDWMFIHQTMHQFEYSQLGLM